MTVVLFAAALAGHPESLALGVVFLALWLAGRFALRDLPDAGLVARSVLASGAAAAGLAAFLLVPTALAIRASNRMVLAALPHWSGAFSLAPHGALWRGVSTAFFPRSLGDAIHVPQIPGVTGAFPEMALGYFGIVGWAAALLWLRPGSARARASWVLVGLIVGGLGVSAALWPFAEIFGAIPVLRHVFPLRFASWAALAGPALAALELDRYARDRAASATAAWGAAAVPLALAGVAVLWFLHLRPELTAPGALGFQKRQLALAVGLLAAAAVLVLATRARTSLLAAGLAALCAADLLYQWRGHYRLFSPSLFYPETPLVRYLRAQPPPFRVAGAGTALFPGTNVFAGVEDVRTHDPVERRDYVAFLDATCGYSPASYFKSIGNPDAPALDFLNARYLVAAPGHSPPPDRWSRVYAGADGQVFESPTVLPRAFVPTSVRLVAEAPASEPRIDANAAFGAAFREIAGNRDWRARAWVLAGRDGEEPGGAAEISGYRESTNAASFDATVGRGGAWIVLSLVQDGGWSARDGGAAIPVSRANGPFLALRLPEGARRVASAVPTARLHRRLLDLGGDSRRDPDRGGAAPTAPGGARMTHPGSPFWVPSAALQRHLNRTATGDPGCDWLSHVRREHFPKRLERTLVLGCGNGFLERALVRHDGVEAILATDADPAAVETAARQARREGLGAIAYAVLDPQRDPLPPGPWNAIIANDLLHHVPEIGALYARIHDALAPRGRFVFSEYTGPSRFQHTDEQMEVVQRYFRLLPDHWRTDPDTGRRFWRRERIDAARLARESPFEAAESDRIVPEARRAFTPEAELSGGGGLLHPLLSGFARNYRDGSSEDERLLDVLCAAEEHLTSLGILAPAFTVFVGRRRDG